MSIEDGLICMTATNHDGHKVHGNENVKKTNGVLLRNRQIHGEFTVIPSSENMLVAVIVEPPSLLGAFTSIEDYAQSVFLFTRGGDSS